MQPRRDTRRRAAIVTNWFNPNARLYLVHPALADRDHRLGRGAVDHAQSVARERELGTFDQLMVSPLRVHEILIGKMVPPFLVGLFNGTLYLIVAPLVFGVPFTGSLLLFYLSLIDLPAGAGRGRHVRLVASQDPAAGVSRRVPGRPRR